MGGGPPGFPQGSTYPVVLRCRLAPLDLSPTGLSPPAVGRSRPLRLDPPVALVAILQPPLPFGNGFGLFPVRSPLLRKSSSPCGDIFLSLPAGTKMFQFPAFPLSALCVQAGVPAHYDRWVPPFGHPRINACLQLPEAFRCWPRPSSAPGAKASTVRPL